MISSSHIFSELTAMMPELLERYKNDDPFYIGLRLENRGTAKVEVLLNELMGALFHIIDSNNNADMKHDDIHPIWKEDGYKGRNLLSVFVCDATSQTVYDSAYYKQSPAKYNLKRDKDIRVLQFNQLDEEGKEQVVEMIAAQISQMQDDFENGTKPEDTGPASNWGEMPWDFQK